MFCLNRAGRKVELGDIEAQERIRSGEMTEIKEVKKETKKELTKEELIIIAKERGIKSPHLMKRETLITKLTNA